VVAACLFSLATYAGIDRFTVQSYIPNLAEMEGVSEHVLTSLSRVGIDSPRALLMRTRTPDELALLSRQAGISEEELRELRAAAQLVQVGGLGAAHYNELRRLGITRVEDLAAQDPEVLVVRWGEVSERVHTLGQVTAWIRAARRHS
jgi:nucleotidyltransferase/DNA polymerase involved in DNA repair